MAPPFSVLIPWIVCLGLLVTEPGVHRQGDARDVPGFIGYEEGDRVADVLWFEQLHRKRIAHGRPALGLALQPCLHDRVDDHRGIYASGVNRIDTDALR